jgi:hypothetical protein
MGLPRSATDRLVAAMGHVPKGGCTSEGAWGRRPEGGAPSSEAYALGARWLLASSTPATQFLSPVNLPKLTHGRYGGHSRAPTH